MSYVHAQRFNVRHYECDANGHVNHANYLRYMQEAAFGASDAVGFGAARYAELNYQWLAYETDITYEKPLVYGDSFTIYTWVENFRRVRSLRRYEIRRDTPIASDGERVTCASTDWVLIDLARRAPAAIPQAIIDGYKRDEPFEPPRMPQRQPLVPPPSPPQDAYTLYRRVEWRDVDPAGHVNNAVYLNYVGDCAFQVHRHYGWPINEMRESGVMLMARRHFIEYKAMAMLDDEIAVTTWMTEPRRSFAMRYFLIRRLSDERVLARVRTQWVWTDLAAGRAARIPAGFLADFAPNIVPSVASTKHRHGRECEPVR